MILYVLLGGVILIALIVILMLLAKQRILQNRIEATIEIFKRSFDISEDAIMIFSEENKVLYANSALRKLLSLPDDFEDTALDPMPQVKIKREWIPLDHFVEELRLDESGRMFSFPQTSLSIDPKAQQSIPINLYIDRSGTAIRESKWHAVIVIHDLRKEQAQNKVAFRHKLTNLPNQLQAKSDLNKLFSKIHLHNKKLALVIIDIDNFSQIRGMIGYEQSENILIHFGRFLEQFSKQNALYVYHTFSNHFLLCLPVIEDTDDVVNVARKIQSELNAFYKLNGVGFHLTASIGVSIYPDSGSTLNLMDRAYKALSIAQKSGYGHIHIYKKSTLEEKYDETELFSMLHRAMEKREFEIYYQPIVCTKSFDVVAAEALIRWKHPEYGFIPPDVFIPMLEKSGAIIELGRFVLSEVLKQQKRWELFKFKKIEVSINVSPLELGSEGFVAHVKKELTSHQVSPDSIKFEITEGLAMEDEGLANRQLYALKKLGVAISLDDFGTGYTSFSYLKQFPADILKIDKTMIDYILEHEEDQRIVNAMIELGHNLGMKTVVEGIESKEMADMVASYGCDYLQGYYFGKPQPAYEFQELIRR